MEAKKLKDWIKLFALILASIVILCCSSKSKPIFKNCEIEELVQKDSIIPSRYNGLNFFCKGIDDNVVKLQYRELKEVYKNQFNNLDYNEYLSKLLNQNVSINTENKVFFKLNNTICEKYRSCNFDSFLSFYCEIIQDGKYRLTKTLSQSELNTFSYFLFVNGYFLIFDDYSGVYRVIFKKNIFCCG